MEARSVIRTGVLGFAVVSSSLVLGGLGTAFAPFAS